MVKAKYAGREKTDGFFWLFICSQVCSCWQLYILDFEYREIQIIDGKKFEREDGRCMAYTKWHFSGKQINKIRIVYLRLYGAECYVMSQDPNYGSKIPIRLHVFLNNW